MSACVCEWVKLGAAKVQKSSIQVETFTIFKLFEFSKKLKIVGFFLQ